MTSVSRRKFITTSLATTVAVGTLANQPARLFARNANQKISLGFIGCGWRGKQLMEQFGATQMADIVAICDPDQELMDMAKATLAPKAKTYTDLRKLLEDPSIDSVVIATCNHWHCLAAIWAMEAGKHVYVEKPLSHTQWEGDQTVAAARRYGKVCQIGTQQRSDPMQAEIKKFLHEEKALGEITAAKINRYGFRATIGKRDKPLEIPKSVDYNLWLGPAQDQPIMRDKLHYDWHWDWNTGSGEMGNWGVHILDDVRNNVFLDSVKLPKRIFGGGGRVVWGDAGNTPNVHFTYFDTGSIPLVIGLTNLPGKPGDKPTKRPDSEKMRNPPSPKTHGPSSGYVAFCEGGELHGQRGKAAAFDKDGNVVREFIGNKGFVTHQKNFLEAVIANDSSMLNAEIEVGHHSTGWCNLANISYRAGSQMSADDIRSVQEPQWQKLIEQMEQHLGVYDLKLDSEAIQMSPMLSVNEEGQFVGAHSEKANTFLKREYRKGFEVPELAAKATL